MEEWRNFYENAKSMSGRSRIFLRCISTWKRSWLKWINCWHKEKVYHVFQRSQMMFAPWFMDHRELWQHVQQCGHKEDISGIYFFYFIKHINSSSHSRQVF
jgi:hypothetical protein